MSNLRVNPQSIALSEYKPPAKPIITASRPTPRPEPNVIVGQIRDNIASDPAKQAALDLLKRIAGVKDSKTGSSGSNDVVNSVAIGTSATICSPAAAPVRAVVATPVATTGPSTTTAVKSNAAAASSPGVSELTAQLKIVHDENIKLKKTIVSLNYDIERLNETLATVSTERDEATAQLLDSDNTDQVHELEDTIISIQTEFEHFKLRSNEAGAKKDAIIADLERHIGELASNNDNLISQLSKCSDYDSILSQLINAQECTNTLEEENSFLTIRLNTATEKVDRLEAVESSMNEKLRKVNEDRQIAERNFELAQAKYADMQRIIDARDAEIASLKAQQTRLLAALKAYIEINDSQ